MTDSALGFTVKSGWACAVLITDSTPPRVADSRRVELSDPDNPDSCQPYHAGFGTARSAGPQLSKLIASVKQFGRRSVTDVIREHQKSGHVLGVGIVVGSLIDPDTIGNDHIRIHALEGQLFRGIVKHAADRRKLPCSVWRERDLYGLASDRLKRSESNLRTLVVALGRGVPGSWRAEQKAAALAALIVLAEAKGQGCC